MSEDSIKSNNKVVRQPEPTNECINVQKIYDWVLINADEVKTIPIPEEELEAINEALDEGAQLQVTGTITLPAGVVTSIVSIVRRFVVIDGVEVEVGCAQILKNVTIDITVTDVSNATPVEVATFTATTQLIERAGICFPQPFTADNVTIHVRSASALPLSDVPIDGNFLFEVYVCQDLQVETQVKLEVLARFCEPRDNTIVCGTGLICEPPSFPPQCPQIYPVV
jgi:hypothetical protein